MTQASDRQGVLQSGVREATLYRLAELASDFGAEHIAAVARTTAERVSAGLFYVACVGQFKRGKSTLLNALVREAILPTGVVPVTAVPTIIRYGRRLVARVRFGTAAWTEIPVSAIADYVSEEKNAENTKRVAGLEIFVPNVLLESGMCLVDTPGLGSVFSGNTAATRAFLPHVDAAVVVIGADPPLSGEELELVQTVAEQVDDLLFVLNKADRATQEERRVSVEFARNVLGQRLGREAATVFEVSALERLEDRGPSRDWDLFVEALQTLIRNSARSLVRDATERGIRRVSHQLLAVVEEEREALLRPIEETERRISKLRQTLGEAEGSIRDLGVLLTAEQQRLSKALAGRRDLFLKRAQGKASKELTERCCLLSGHRNGPSYRREINHLAQDIAREQLGPWLEEEARYARDEFRKTASRFTELGNDFLRRLSEAGIPGLEELPEEVNCEQGLGAGSQFRFHVIERVASPASPLLLVSDLVLGALGLRGKINRDGREFLAQLLEVNSSRVQSDVDERVRESRRKLDREIKGILGEAVTVVDRALARARTAQAEGAPAVEAALARLNSIENEVQNSLTGPYR
ncbi:MAG TPA: dynamin family protein [Candidatus Cybelea sp.]|nr:dynamin family protein [Candidatus Cybelea sp.]